MLNNRRQAFAVYNIEFSINDYNEKVRSLSYLFKKEISLSLTNTNSAVSNNVKLTNITAIGFTTGLENLKEGMAISADGERPIFLINEIKKINNSDEYALFLSSYE